MQEQGIFYEDEDPSVGADPRISAAIAIAVNFGLLQRAKTNTYVREHSELRVYRLDCS
jgi:hypothetical protein